MYTIIPLQDMPADTCIARDQKTHQYYIAHLVNGGWVVSNTGPYHGFEGGPFDTLDVALRRVFHICPECRKQIKGRSILTVVPIAENRPSEERHPKCFERMHYKAALAAGKSEEEARAIAAKEVSYIR